MLTKLYYYYCFTIIIFMGIILIKNCKILHDWYHNMCTLSVDYFIAYLLHGAESFLRS